MSKLHLVFGGRVKDPRGLDFDMNTIDLVGIYDSYAAAEEAWRGRAQRTVDDAEMKYVVVHLHRLLEPDMDGISRPRQPAQGYASARRSDISTAAAGAAAAAPRRTRRHEPVLPADSPGRCRASPSSAGARSTRPAARRR